LPGLRDTIRKHPRLVDSGTSADARLMTESSWMTWRQYVESDSPRARSLSSVMMAGMWKKMCPDSKVSVTGVEWEEMFEMKRISENGKRLCDGHFVL
jgi:hypothetical protein